AKSQEPTQEIMEPEIEEPEIEKPSIDEINISKKNLKSQYQDKTRKRPTTFLKNKKNRQYQGRTLKKKNTDIRKIRRKRIDEKRFNQYTKYEYVEGYVNYQRKIDQEIMKMLYSMERAENGKKREEYVDNHQSEEARQIRNKETRTEAAYACLKDIAVNEIEAKVRGKIYSFDDEYGDIKRWILKELELFKDLKLRYEQADAQETQGVQYRLGTVTEREIFDEQELKEEWMDNDKPK
ncbi:6930_t:CDS:2, partial [Funneliformis caledonium]